MRKAIIVLAASLLATPALATDYSFDFTGDVAGGSTATFDAGGFRFNFFTIPITNFGPTTFQVGDSVAATITFTQRLTVPSATVRNGVDLILLNTDYPGTTTGTSGMTTLFDGGVQSMFQMSGTTSTDQVVNSLLDFTGSSYSFDSARSDFTVTALGAASLATDTAYFRYLTVDALPAAVPEPASWALMITGFGAMGVVLRRRRLPTPRPA